MDSKTVIHIILYSFTFCGSQKNLFCLCFGKIFCWVWMLKLIVVYFSFSVQKMLLHFFWLTTQSLRNSCLCLVYNVVQYIMFLFPSGYFKDCLFLFKQLNCYITWYNFIHDSFTWCLLSFLELQVYSFNLTLIWIFAIISSNINFGSCTHVLNHLELSHSLLLLCSFSVLPSGLLLDSFYCFVFRFTNLFFCNVICVGNSVLCIFHLRYIFPSLEVKFGSLLYPLCLSLTCLCILLLS